MPSGADTPPDLRTLVEALTDRVARLEDSRSRAAHRDTAIVEGLLRDLDGDGSGTTGPATVVYAGAGTWGDGTAAWQAAREWDEVVEAADEPVARILSALANGTRLRIVGELLRGRRTTAELTEQLDQPSSGQLFHHLKELIAAGVVHQPVRGTYAIRVQHVVPILAVLSAALDLTSTAPGEVPS